jgi:serine/threonine-protein kinase
MPAPPPRSTRALFPHASSVGTRTTRLSPDLVAESARRLHVLALLYGFAFFMSAVLPVVLFADARHYFFSSPLRWVAPIASLIVAGIVVLLTRRDRFDPARVMTVALAFQIAGSFGIAAAQYLDAGTYADNPPWAGLSWVAVWVLGSTVTMPNPPLRSLMAALVSVSSVPLTVGLALATQASPVRLSAITFFFMLVLPYLIVVLIAYVSAQVIYKLGTALTRARDLGSYRLIERLGHGGMGEVWRAEHRLLARPAAVKLMSTEVAARGGHARQAEFLTRFEREAQATAMLRSPHTVELYDFGIADDGGLYYVMELLEGYDLGALVERFGPVPPERAVALLLQVCHSLGEAHSRGLIHRDIKPANVYVCRHGRDVDFVKVLDFGLVKSTAHPDQTDLNLSRGGSVGGTPAFMAPEQALGNRQIDGRADIYATGCVAYWLLTGRRLFEGQSSMEVLMQHIQAPPTPPSAHLDTALPPGLESIVLACLAKNPDERPATADELHERLAGIPLEHAWTPERRSEWWRVHASETGSPPKTTAATPVLT